MTWDNIDPINNTINVNKSIGRRKVSETNTTVLYLKDPKNFTCKRIKTIDPNTLIALMEWREHNPHKWVFVNDRGKWLNPSKPRKWLRRVSANAGLNPIPVHMLRHTHATLLHEAVCCILHNIMDLTKNQKSHFINDGAFSVNMKLYYLGDF